MAHSATSKSGSKPIAEHETETGSGENRLKRDVEEVSICKRLPKRWPVRVNDVYVNNKTNHQAQLNRCKKLLESGFNEILIHGLGAAVHRAINMALQLESDNPSLHLHVNTSSVRLKDDVVPLTDNVEFSTQTRINSAVHIKVYRLTADSETKPTT